MKPHVLATPVVEKRPKGLRTLLCAIVIDEMAGGGKTVEEEIRDLKAEFLDTVFLNPIKFYRAWHAGDGDHGIRPLLLFPEFNAWDWCYEWQKERYVKAWSDLCASNMRFATLAAKIYAMVPVTIRIPIGEFLNSPVFKETHDKP